MNVAQLITGLFQTYEKQEQKERLDIYIAMLKSVPIELLQKAIMKCISEKKYLPSIAEILEECESIKETVTGEKKFKDWDDAWAEIYKGWCEGSPYKEKPKWSTPEIEHTVESFGWLTLLNAEESQTQTIRAQMKVLYETACKRKLTTSKNKNILEGKTGFEQLSGSINKLLGGFAE